MEEGHLKWTGRPGRVSPCRIYLSPPPRAVIEVKLIVVWGGVGWGGCKLGFYQVEEKACGMPRQHEMK